MNKETLREEARLRRSILSDHVPDFAQKVSSFAEAVRGFAKGAVGGYLPLPREADPTRLMSRLAELGVALALPCVVDRAQPLVYRRWSNGDPTVRNRYGVREPVADAETIEPSLLLVPLLAFDASGFRLGYGGGYYDRTLDRLRSTSDVIAIGLAFAGQEVDALPRAAHDHRLDMIITEHGLRAFG